MRSTRPADLTTPPASALFHPTTFCSPNERDSCLIRIGYLSYFSIYHLKTSRVKNAAVLPTVSNWAFDKEGNSPPICNSTRF
jgi:hypothetical protein